MVSRNSWLPPGAHVAGLGVAESTSALAGNAPTSDTPIAAAAAATTAAILLPTVTVDSFR
jgi:hypothetical protein